MEYIENYRYRSQSLRSLLPAVWKKEESEGQSEGVWTVGSLREWGSAKSLSWPLVKGNEVTLPENEIATDGYPISTKTAGLRPRLEHFSQITGLSSSKYVVYATAFV